MYKLLSLLIFMISCNAFSDQWVYITSSNKTLDIYKFNSSSGSLTLKEKFPLKGSPGNMVFSLDKKHLYVAVRSGTKKEPLFGIETLRIKGNGGVESLAFGMTPEACGFLSIDSTGNYLFSSHYGPGCISSYKLNQGLYKGELLQKIAADERPHSIVIDRTGSLVFAPHTSPNKVYKFNFTDEKLSKIGKGYVDGPAIDKRYHEPRHLVFHPKKNYFYTANENGGGLSHWKYDSGGSLELVKTVCTLPEDNNHRFFASDLTISKDGRFIYVANRDCLERHAPKGKDSIAVYELDTETGEILNTVGSYATGRHPRCLKIDSTGNYLFANGVFHNTIMVYKRDKESGTL